MNNKEKVEKYLKEIDQKRLYEIQKDWVKRQFDTKLQETIDNCKHTFEIIPRHPSEVESTYQMVDQLLEEEDLDDYMVVTCPNFKTFPIRVSITIPEVNIFS